MSQLSYTNLINGDTPTANGFNTRFLLAINLLNSGVETDNIAALAVTTPKIAAGAVDGTKLAMGSDAQGDTLYYNGTAYARLGAGTSGQFLQTQGAGANPQWASVSSTHSREGCFVSQASSATITVSPGFVDVNGVRTISSTTLTLTTAADWAGGSSLQATSTFGFVGVDASGNIKMHTTAPTHDDYAVSSTAGIKRYATWSSTVYRIIGWFYMNATGAGELNSYEVGNFRDGDVYNMVSNGSLSDITLNDTTYGTDMDATAFHIYTSGRPVEVLFNGAVDASDPGDVYLLVDVDGTDKTDGETNIRVSASGGNQTPPMVCLHGEKIAAGTHTIKIQGKVDASSVVFRNWIMTVKEL